MQCELWNVSELCFRQHLQGVNVCVKQPDSKIVWTCQSAHTTINGLNQKLQKEGSVTENCLVAAISIDRVPETKVIPAAKGNNCVASLWFFLHGMHCIPAG